MSGDLDVRFADRLVGKLRSTDSGRLTFSYDAAWCVRPGAFPISLSLPLSVEPYVTERAHAFFANLLPEGGARTAVCSRLGISVDNDFALLRAIGGDCAGALSIEEPSTPFRTGETADEYDWLTPVRLHELAKKGASILVGGGSATRLSLAGVQDKLPVKLFERQLYVSTMGAPSTHILKLPTSRFKHLLANEAFVLGLARRVGLDAVAAELFPDMSPPGLLITRYDRVTEDGQRTRRLHQEDLCQGLGLPPTRKYEQEGGPDLVRATIFIREHSAAPLIDVPRLISWQAFNVIAGNSDGHGKNLSILYTEAGARLAPFYDLLSTRHYDRLDRELAMGVGGLRNPDEIGRKQWAAFSADVGIAARVTLELVEAMCERVLAEMPAWKLEFQALELGHPIVQELPIKIARRARSAIRRLR